MGASIMSANYVSCRPTQLSSVWRRGLLVMLLASQLLLILDSGIVRASPQGRPLSQSVTSLLGLDDLAKKTLNQINLVINNANQALKADLALLTADVNGIIDKLDTTYKDLLNVSINNLGAAAQNFASTVARQLNDINTMLNQILTNVQVALHAAIQDFHNQIGQLMAQFEDSASKIVVQVTQSATYVIDRAAWDTIGVVAIVLLLLGLLILAVVIIVTKGLPSGVSGIIVVVLVVLFVLVGILLAFVPAAKAQALKTLGKGQDVPTIPIQPLIFNVEPNPVILGQATEIKINGVHLQLNSGTTPEVTINGVKADIHAIGDTQIIVAAPTTGSATVQLTLTYNNGTPSVGAPLGLATTTPVLAPALIVISNYHIDPANPVAGKTTVHAYVTVANKGMVTSKPFTITWKPRPSENINIGGTLVLAPNETKNLTSDGYVYPNGGTFSTEVNSNSSEMGSNPVFLSTQVNVLTPTSTPIPPTVTFKTGPVKHPSCGLTCGQQGDDALNTGNSAGPGCIITSVYLQLVDNNGTVVPGTTVAPLVTADAGSPSHYNGEIKNDPRGGNDYTLTVHWGSGPNVSVNYQILYFVQGNNCVPPSGTVR
jgi:ElaB/YqjD/DUF883 family membrane-anchored ribosome-binding protein